MGILKALEWCQAEGITEVTLYFDYQGLESWVTGAWRAKLPFTQFYAQTVNASDITIHWIKIKAHSGNPENEIVDQLAKEGAMQQKVEKELERVDVERGKRLRKMVSYNFPSPFK